MKSEEASSDDVREAVNASGQVETHASITSTARCTLDEFRRCILAEHNPEEIYLQLNSRGIDGSPNTCEARLKEAVLSTDRKTIGATATGKGGVGKTCALRAIAHDDDINAQFSGGVYLMSLGKDANVGRLIEQLCMAVKASGGNQAAAKMREQSELSRVLTEMRAWFNTRVCLFIIDDVWAVNGIDACILQKLSILADTAGDIRERSRLLYSTRDSELKQVGKRVTFEPREKEGSDSVHMVMLASGANPEEANDPRCKEAVSEILKSCAGLPLALNVAWTGVRCMRDRWEGEKSQAWEAYLKMKSRNTLRSESPEDGYSSLDATLHAALDILESGMGSDAERLRQFSFRKIHRSLCIMKKQDRMPLSLVRELWEMDYKLADKCAKQMDRVGLVDLHYDNDGGWVRMHDLTHDFAVQEAQKEESATVWYKKLADVCKQGGGLLAITESEGRESKDAREKYVFENTYRVLKQGGCVEELKNLFLKAQWVKAVIQRGGVWQYGEAVKDRSSFLSNKGGSESLLRDTGEEDSLYAMELMMRAARLSVPFCGENSAGIYFQLYGRVKHKARDSSCVRKILEEIETYAPRPWVQPVSECVARADGRLVEQIVFPSVSSRAVQVGMDSRGEVNGCWVEWHEGAVTVFTQSAEKETKMVRLEGEFETASQSPGDLEARSVTSEVTGKRRSVTSATCATFCERKGYVVVGYDDGTLRLWSTSETKVLRSFRGHRSEVRCVAMSGDGRRVVSGSEDASVRVWDVETGAQVGEALVGHTDVVRSVAMSGDGKRVVSGSEDKSVRVWDVETGAQVGDALVGHTGMVNSVTISGDGRRVVSGSWDTSVRVWDVETGERVGDALIGHTDSVESVAMSGDGRRVVSGSFDGSVRVWDVETGEQVGEALVGHTDRVDSVAMSGDGKRVVSGSEDDTVRVWDVETGEQVEDALVGHTGYVRSVAMSGDRRRVVSGSYDKSVRVWDVETGAQVGDALVGHTDGVVSVAMSGDGKRVVSESGDKSVRVWDVETGAQVGDALVGHTSSVNSVAMSGDGRRVVSGSYDKSVRVWDVETGEQVGEALVGHTGYVLSVAMSGDGRRVVSGSWDNSVRVWDVETGEQVGEALVGHTGPVDSVAISEDGRRVVSGSWDKSVRVWDVERRSTLHVGRVEGWQETTSRFLRTADVGTASRAGRTSQMFARKGRIVHRREDGSEAVLAELDNPRDLQIDHDRGVVVAGVGHLVAIMKVMV
ncbi:unnamed protein product [Chondrus crispus]|uniref:NB-ARC domain-containing protein n=1 Tax=Chondrus crispus TaxID=2769 RepID=R7QDU5_CHOCR|nr:unnamed protein product [Chondrus crispus]CDF36259.1 unnamed protein product [Chondrus crispus]|eukprot:XP_005716078.1 unnamed protein product [Chondrus crispus]